MDFNTELKAVSDLLSMLLNPRNALLIGLLLGAAWSDFRTGRIPNWLVLCGAVIGLTCNTLLPASTLPPLTALWSALAGLLCGLGILLPLYLMRAMGAGDVKLMAMCGAFLGFPEILWAALATFLAGGLLALTYLLWNGGLRRALRNITDLGRSALFDITLGSKPTLAVDAKNSTGTLPYALAIAAGTIGYLVINELGLVR